MSESIFGEEMLKALNLKSEHAILETINKLEAATFSWKERIIQESSGKSPIRTSWSFLKDPVSGIEKMELLLERAETLLNLLKTRHPNLPQTFLDAAKVQYGKVSFLLMLTCLFYPLNSQHCSYFLLPHKIKTPFQIKLCAI